MTKGKGYLLPSGDAEENDLECCIVFYPARDEYRRALMGSLDFLATWLAWERDSGKRGQDAAASWKLANIQTWECTNMGYCDDLATTLQALLAATQALECCGEQDITDGLQYTDDIVDGVGNVPQNIIDAGYASGTGDWAGFDDYKCMISHLAVDHIETFFREISPFVSDTGIVIGGIGVVGALLGAILVVVGLPISAGILVALGASAGIWTWISTYGKTAVEDLADEIADNHDALVCAIYDADGVTDAIDDFNDEVDSLFSAIEAVAIKAVGFEPQLRAMYAGRYDQEDIAENLDDLGYDLVNYFCECVDFDPPPSGYQLVYPTGVDSYVGGQGCTDNGSTYNPATGILVLNFTNNSNDNTEFKANMSYSTNPLSYHGYIFDYIGSSIPGHQQCKEPMQNIVTGYYWIHATIPANAWAMGTALAGYNTSRHSGSTWVDWAAQYANVVNCTWERDAIKWLENPDGSGPLGDYSITMRVRYLIPV